MTQIDLKPAADALAALVAGVRDDQLDDPTPCADMTVAAVLDHVDGFAWAFDCAARKQTVPGDQAPRADADQLVAGWRTEIPDRLAVMARAWDDPAAWEGDTSVGGVDQTAQETGRVGIDELIVHSWDLSRATGQPYDIDDASVEAARVWVEPLASDAGIPGLFGPRVDAPEGASALERLVALTGRDPGWGAGWTTGS